MANLGEITNKMASIIVSQCKNIEHKWLNVVIKCLVIKKQLGQKTQILTVNLRHVAVNFKYRPVVLAIDFITRRMQQQTPCL